MKKDHDSHTANRVQRPGEGKEARRRALFAAIVLALCLFVPLQVFAAASPLESVNKLSDFVFAAIKGVGVIILGFGMMQLGLSLKSHDPQQRAQGVLASLGGMVIFFAKEIIDMIV